MAGNLRKSDKVRWDSRGGEAAGRKVRAGQDDPKRDGQ
jgi:hypothetical protein